MVVNWATMGPEKPVPHGRTREPLYTFDAAGAPQVRCIHCGARTPVWGERIIQRGHMAPVPNKRFGMRFANGTIDDRKVLWIPFITKGPGCVVCTAAYDEMQRTAPSGKTAFLPDGVKV